MSTKETYFCDNCGKEFVNDDCITTIVVYAVQNSRPKFKGFQESDDFPYWKHREKYSAELCDDCIGERVTINHGCDKPFGLSDMAMSFLRKFGFLQTKGEGEE